MRTILVTEYVAPKGKRRWKAEFGDGTCAVKGFGDVATAIGALVRRAANDCETTDEIIDLIAGLLDGLVTRTANAALGRWIRDAHNVRRGRKHPGVEILIVHQEQPCPQPNSET